MEEMIYLVDPYIFSFPVNEDETELRKYLDALIEWCQFFGDHPETCVTCEHGLYALMDEGRFPTKERIANLLQTYQIVQFTSVDLMRLMSRITERRPYVRDKLQFSALNSVDARPIPQGFADRLGAQAGRAFLDTLLLVAFSCDGGISKNKGFITDYAIATRNWQKDWPDQLHVFGNVDMLERADKSLEAIELGGFGRFDVIDDPSEGTATVELSSVYNDPRAAVEQVFENLPYLRELPRAQIRYSADFILSIERNGIQTQPAILHTLYMRVALASVGKLGELKGAKLHPMRTSKAPDAPQKEREDGAKLWRCMVSQTGAGYRLHYWQLGKRMIELHSVTLESES